MEEALQEQRIYYNDRWSQSLYINELQLQRLNIILQAIQKLGLIHPRILDFGCGTGWLTSIINHIGPTTGIDLSNKAIAASKRTYPGVEFISGNLFEHPFQKASFDLVISQEVIEHVNDQERYLELVAKYLKVGGFLILTTPNAFNLKSWSKKELESWGMQPIEKWLTLRKLRKLLAAHFKVTEMTTIISGYGGKGQFALINSAHLNSMSQL